MRLSTAAFICIDRVIALWDDFPSTVPDRQKKIVDYFLSETGGSDMIYRGIREIFGIKDGAAKWLISPETTREDILLVLVAIKDRARIDERRDG